MTDEKWLDLLDTLKQKFDVKIEKEEEITNDDLGQVIINEIDRAYFQSGLGYIKLERVTRPVILDKKVHYSHTAGSKSRVEYILSPDEKSQKVYIYRENDGGWEEVKIPTESFRF